jgi:signal transduction histidine kinase
LVTPVYVNVQSGPELLNVLVIGFPVDQDVARDLKDRTGGSDFVFLSMGGPVSSTLTADESKLLAREYRRGTAVQRIRLSGREFAVLGTPLHDISGSPAGDLLIVHNFDAIRRDLNSLQNQLVLIWAAAVVAGLALSLYLAGRILQPISRLDHAATLIGQQKYDTRVPEGGNDELGRLSRTFNDMCRSIQAGRDDLIRQERIATIGRLSSSIVHDLRNPLASIYGGAEMMMDGDLSQSQLQRLARNIYRSSRVIKDMLQQLVDVSRGRVQSPESCHLGEVIGAAVESQTPSAETQAVEIRWTVDPAIEIPLEPGRMERVFVNLIANAVEAMPDGGRIDISVERLQMGVVVHVDDTGPGIPAEVRERLFQPFVSSGKNGLGIGLALSRQTVLDHGGDLWVEDGLLPGAHFRIRLPA